MSDIRTILIVGASLTGVKTAEALRKEGYDGRIVLFGEESQPPYLRPPLSKEYLRGEGQLDTVFVHPEAWYEEQRIELHTSTPVRAIEPATREVVLDGGRRVTFDRLLLATGTAPRRLNIPGSDLAGVHYLRTLPDADAIRDAVTTARRAIVIGGGWIGAEVAASLRQLGLPVTLVAPASVPLERVLGTVVGSVYADLHAEHGVALVMNQRAVAFRGETGIAAVETTDGTRIEGDLVVVGVGARPRTELAVGAGLDVRDGILVDERLETCVPGIFAAGDVAAAWHPLLGARIRVEHWDNARRQGRAAARNMLGLAEPYVRIPYFYSDQYDLGMEYAGFAPAWDQVVFRGEPASRSFVAFWLTDGRVVAGMNANVSKVNDALAALVASREEVAIERLSDSAVALHDLEALLLPGGKTTTAGALCNGGLKPRSCGPVRNSEVKLMLVRIGKATDVGDGQMRVFDVAGTNVNVSNANGRLYAFDDTCTHMGCSLADGELDGTTVTCACHDSQFDVTSGAVLRGPAPRPVRSRRVQVEGADLLVEA